MLGVARLELTVIVMIGLVVSGHLHSAELSGRVIAPVEAQTGETLAIPANTLKPDRDYFAYVLAVIEVNTGQGSVFPELRGIGAKAVSAYITKTEFTLSTKSPRLICGVAGFILGTLISPT